MLELLFVLLIVAACFSILGQGHRSRVQYLAEKRRLRKKARLDERVRRAELKPEERDAEDKEKNWRDFLFGLDILAIALLLVYPSALTVFLVSCSILAASLSGSFGDSASFATTLSIPSATNLTIRFLDFRKVARTGGATRASAMAASASFTTSFAI